MDIFGVLTLIGGLALFLFGMNTMGDGLVRLSGSRLDRILGRLTSNALLAVLLGTAVTAVIQSSSATTVMVVGFVNSGMMSLSQAVGVIMGANIGTTVTSWLLSLTGISGSSLVLRLLKPSSFSPILGAIGIILYFTAKENARRKDISTILLGFAVLMFGMNTMSSSVEPLAENEAFTGVLLLFSNPLLGVLLGAVLTAVIQSSSASIGILQAFCLTGAVSYGTALPIILGQNIGTCVTALLSGIGAGKNAKRAGMMHLYFNLIGTIGFLIIFYLLNAFMHFSFLEQPASVVGIAVIHSLFNIGCCLLLFPFRGMLVRLATLSIPDREKKESTQEKETRDELAVLDERFLENPAYATSVCRDCCVRMSQLSAETVDLAVNLMRHYRRDTAAQLEELEERLDAYEDALSGYLVKISGHALREEDSKSVSVMLQCIRDFERIADHADNIKFTLEDRRRRGVHFTEEGMQELLVFAGAVQDIVGQMILVFENHTMQRARLIKPFEEVIDNLSLQLKQRHVRRLRSGAVSPESGVLLEDVITDLERISDHCCNVGICMILVEIGDEGAARLQMNEPSGEDDKWFREEYDRLRKRYVFPDEVCEAENQIEEKA